MKFILESVELAERPVRLRLPFRFGVITLTEAPQAFLSVRIRTADGRQGQGLAASMLAPKWFDKSPEHDNDTNIDHLRQAVAIAAAAYRHDGQARTGYGHFAANYQAVVDTAAARGINALSASFGPALLDAALVDALGQAVELPFGELARRNVLGLQPEVLAPDLATFDTSAWLAERKLAGRMAARHTVGLVDPIASLADSERTTHDGLPETLAEVIERYGHRHFKLKVSGDLPADLDRLTRIAAVLDRAELPYQATLDGNEQFDSVEPVEQLWRRMTETPALTRLVNSIVFIEQPIKRTATMTEPVHAMARHKALIIDESDDSLEAFPRALALGYSGVSSKLCKGLYKSLTNAARCAQANAAGQPWFMSAEDLTNQAGVAVQQDLALVNLIGLDHVERNGHHYVDGFGGAPAAIQQAFAADHPDLYRRDGDASRLNIEAGHLNIGSLNSAGFALGPQARQAVLESLSNTFQGV